MTVSVHVHKRLLCVCVLLCASVCKHMQASLFHLRMPMCVCVCKPQHVCMCEKQQATVPWPAATEPLTDGDVHRRVLARVESVAAESVQANVSV